MMMLMMLMLWVLLVNSMRIGYVEAYLAMMMLLMLMMMMPVLDLEVQSCFQEYLIKKVISVKKSQRKIVIISYLFVSIFSFIFSPFLSFFPLLLLFSSIFFPIL